MVKPTDVPLAGGQAQSQDHVGLAGATVADGDDFSRRSMAKLAWVNPYHPYLENDPAPSFDPHHLRISPWL